jgi:hypothetical protein
LCPYFGGHVVRPVVLGFRRKAHIVQIITSVEKVRVISLLATQVEQFGHLPETACDETDRIKNVNMFNCHGKDFEPFHNQFRFPFELQKASQ